MRLGFSDPLYLIDWAKSSIFHHYKSTQNHWQLSANSTELYETQITGKEDFLYLSVLLRKEIIPITKAMFETVWFLFLQSDFVVIKTRSQTRLQALVNNIRHVRDQVS